MISANLAKACSECFSDEGLRLDAVSIGRKSQERCPRCNSNNGSILSESELMTLAHRFMCWGSIQRCEYGGAPLIQMNTSHQTDVVFNPMLQGDLAIFESVLSLGFFHYGPRLWMIGEIDPLKDLRNPKTRKKILKRLLSEYPSLHISVDSKFYRIRCNPNNPDNVSEYDSPPQTVDKYGRFDSKELRVMYASPDLQVCLHECRVTVEDDLYLATLKPLVELKLLDLTFLLDENVTEFESLDLAVHMLFLAGKHSYEISREIAIEAKSAGFDGIVYPSFFSLVRTGSMPFETTYGISHRRIPSLREYNRTKTVENLALFDNPIKDQKVKVHSINRLILRRVDYSVQFGPVSFE